jgi:hypothetical protein
MFDIGEPSQSELPPEAAGDGLEEFGAVTAVTIVPQSEQPEPPLEAGADGLKEFAAVGVESASEVQSGLALDAGAGGLEIYMEEIAAEVVEVLSGEAEEAEVSSERAEEVRDIQGRIVISVTVTYIVIMTVSHAALTSVIVAVSIVIPETVVVADVELPTTAEVQSSAAVATAILAGAEAGALTPTIA